MLSPLLSRVLAYKVMEIDDQIYVLVILEEKPECLALLIHSHVVATMLSCVVNRQNIRPDDSATISSAVAPMRVNHRTDMVKLLEGFRFHNCKFRSSEFENFNGAWEIQTVTFLSLETGKEFSVALPRHNVTEIFTALSRGVGYSNGDENNPTVKNFLARPSENI